ncbi:hypothetical protein [Streptomyces lushanensis]|uniref:hypothetical protein n=1 Tax=Streptomyces lushanensis TaxID=1434255 RepID=UPI0008310290|nr:hypothetical protein [Streptomyces lushanensis]
MTSGSMTTGRAARAGETETATRDRLASLSHLEALGEARFPVGDTDAAPTGRPLTVAGRGHRGIRLRTEGIVRSSPVDDAEETAPGTPHRSTRI